MSIFEAVSLDCPNCGRSVQFQASASVNADRRPDLRAAILDGSFQRQPCPHCGTSFRLDPQLNYLDVGRGQWFAAFPAAWVDQWQTLETRAQSAYDKAFGVEAADAAREIGDTLAPRVVFGWHGLREKLVAADAGLDDVALELTKMSLMRGMSDPPLPLGQELRLTELEPAAEDSDPDLAAAASDGDGPGDALSSASLVLWMVPSQPGGSGDELRVPRAIYDDIVAEPADWAALREQVGAGLFVDVMRLTRGTAEV